jgi:polysaccharide chain length determinant protein (PEP-CTERM system associated)
MEFRQKNMAFLSDQSYYKKLQTSLAEVSAVKQLLREYNGRKKQLEDNLKDIPSFIPSTGMGPSLSNNSGSSTSALQGRINSMEARLDELYAKGYKDQHPDVRIVMNQIETLKARQEKEQAAFSEALEKNDTKALQASGGVMPNPVYDQLSIKLIDLDGEIASLQSRLKQKEDSVRQLQAMAHRIPEVEAELARLNRDYDVLKKNYNEMLSKRESAKISSDLETNTDRVRFRVIDPPQEALEPSSPNRLLFVFGVLIIGVGAGVFVAFILSQMHATYSTEQNLRDTFPYPVLGSISILPSQEELQLRKRKLIMFSIMMTGLFMSSISVYVLMTFMYLPSA